MDASKNINKKNYNVHESIPYINNNETSNPTINNCCNINLGKTTYYFNEKNKENPYINNSNIDIKNNILFDPCNILQNHNSKVTNTPDGGQLLVLDIKLKNIKPNKILVLGVFIYENNNLYSFKVKKFSTKNLSNNEYNNIFDLQFSFFFSNIKQFRDRKIKIKFVYDYVMF